MVKAYKILVAAIILVAHSTVSYSQRVRVQEEDAREAEKYKKIYEDNGEMALSSKEIYTWDFSIRNGQLEVNLEFEETIMALKDNYEFAQAVYFNSYCEVDKLKGRRSRGGKISLYGKVVPVKVSGIFYHDAKMHVFDYLLSTRGEKFEYSYEKTFFDVKYLTKAFFHTRYPIKEKRIVFVIPNWMNIDLLEMNFEGYDISKKEIIDDRKELRKIEYVLRDLKPVKSENRMPNQTAFLPHILIISKSRVQNGKTIKLMASTDDLYNWYKSLVDSVDNIPDDFSDHTNKLVADCSNDLEKMESIFYWVQDNIKYIAFEDGIMGFKPESAQNVYNHKYGDCKGMANLLKHMLKLHGFDARLTWLGTRGIPYDYSIPSLAVDNHMICTVLLYDRYYFLDPTEDFIGIGDYATRIQGRPVMIEDAEKYLLKKIPEFDHNRNLIKSSYDIKLNGDVLTGSVEQIYNGEEKTNILRGYSEIVSDEKENALKRYLSRNDKNISIRNIEYTNLEDRNNPLNIKYDFELSNYITSVGNEIYFNIDPEKEFESFKFDEDRKNDYEFKYKVFIQSDFSLSIPDGYVIKYLPEPVNLKHEDFSFNLSFSKEGRKIIYNKEIIIYNALVKKDDFDTWNDYISKLTEFYNNQIIITKS